VLKAVGVSATVADAPEEIKEVVDYITTKKGGDGAVRELIEVILKCQNRFEEAVSIFLQKLEKGEKP
jgi:3-deoxy-D-manno-octulosonate 8-phosphate phosphatase (KDO 8-P phosphatase)